MMQLQINRREAHTLSIVLIATRSFMGIAIDGAEYMNSGWACMLLGYVLALPLAIAADRSVQSRISQSSILPKIAYAIFGIIAAYETAAILRMLVNTASYCALSTLSTFALTVFLLICIYYAVQKNGRGCGNASKLWLCAFIPIMLIVIVAQYGEYNVYWLAPAFAPGAFGIIEGGIAAAGYFAAAAVLHMTAEGEYDKRASCLLSLTTGAVAGVVLCALRGMLAPAMIYVNNDRLSQLDALLTNGRSSLALQLPLIYSWFTSLITTLAGYAFISTRCAREILPMVDGRICSGIVVILAFIAAATGLAESGCVKFAAKWEYIAIALPLLVVLGMSLVRSASKGAKAS